MGSEYQKPPLAPLLASDEDFYMSAVPPLAWGWVYCTFSEHSKNHEKTQNVAQKISYHTHFSLFNETTVLEICGSKKRPSVVW